MQPFDFDTRTVDNQSVIKITSDINGAPDKAEKRLTFKFYNVASPKTIGVDKSKLKRFSYNAASRTLVFEVRYTLGKDVEITVNY